MVFVWMGEGEPAPIEEDVPPEFFRKAGALLFAREVWPVNWRVAMENSMDAHPPYVHRNSAFFLMGPLRSARPDYVRLELLDNRIARIPWESFRASGYRAAPGAPSGQGQPGGPPAPYQMYFPALQAFWPRHGWRLLWAWAFQWASRRRYSLPPREADSWWGGWFQQRLPCMARMDYRTHMHTRVNVPLDESHSRQVFFHYARADSWLGRLYERLHFHLFHRWAMYSNFAVQDFRAMAPQQFDTPEYLSSTDVQVVAFRRLLLQAREGRVRARPAPVLPGVAES
jgi:hypothetical protein